MLVTRVQELKFNVTPENSDDLFQSSVLKLQLQLHNNSPFHLQIRFYNCRNCEQLHVKICPECTQDQCLLSLFSLSLSLFSVPSLCLSLSFSATVHSSICVQEHSTFLYSQTLWHLLNFPSMSSPADHCSKAMSYTTMHALVINNNKIIYSLH